jgi:hypothetical protein
VTLALIAIELFTLPRVLATTSPGPAYGFIREQQGTEAVLELPSDALSAPALLHQTYHEKPIVGGYTSRHFPYPFSEAAPGVSQLVRGDPAPLTGSDILTPPASATALDSLDYYGVRYIVVHKDEMSTGRYGRLQEVLNALFTGGDRVYEDDDVLIYRTPTRSQASGGGGRRLPLVGLGSGWHRPEDNPLHRWTGSNVTDGNAFVWVGVPPGAEGSYTLTTTVYAYKGPRTLSIELDGRTLLTQQVGDAFIDLQVDLGRLEVGNHQILLRLHEPPESPPGDERKLAIGATRLAVERTAP